MFEKYIAPLTETFNRDFGIEAFKSTGEMIAQILTLLSGLVLAERTVTDAETHDASTMLRVIEGLVQTLETKQSQQEAIIKDVATSVTDAYPCGKSA